MCRRFFRPQLQLDRSFEMIHGFGKVAAEFEFPAPNQRNNRSDDVKAPSGTPGEIQRGGIALKDDRSAGRQFNLGERFGTHIF